MIAGKSDHRQLVAGICGESIDCFEGKSLYCTNLWETTLSGPSDGKITSGSPL